MKKIIFFIISFFVSLILYAQDGSLDTDYNPNLSPNLAIQQIYLQPDDKALILELISYSPVKRRITRLSSNGAVDATFNCALGTNREIRVGAIQPDGKILVIENYVQLGLKRTLLHRLNPDGSIDTSFNTLTGGSGYLYSTAVQPDGKIIISGTIVDYINSDVNKIARLLTDGSVDLTFQFDTPTIWAQQLKLTNDEKIFAHYYSGFGLSRVIRLNSDGTLDSNFNIIYSCGGYNYILQSDGKMVLRDLCYDWNFAILPFELLYRVNADGSTDGTFHSGGFEPSYEIFAKAQTDDKIVVTGYITAYDNIPVSNILRLLPNGELDTTFDGGAGPNEGLADLVQQSDGKIIIVGQFTQYDNVPRNHIARLNSTRLSVNDFKERNISVFPNPARDVINLNLPEGITVTDYEIYDILSKRVAVNELKTSSINISGLSSGVYIIKLKSDSRVLKGKFIKE